MAEPDWEALLRPDEDEEPVRRFTARFDSEGVCGHMIYEGEPAGYIGDDTDPTCGDCLPEQ